jgi:hypothetical protein
MANTILTIDMITREALRILENNLTFTKQCNREYDDQFGVTGAKIGDTLRIRKPARYTVRSGTTLSVQDQTETSTSLTLNSQKGVDISFTSKELTLNLDDFSQRVLAPAVAALANQIDRDGLSLYLDVFNAVGTPGTTPSTLLTYLQAGEKMDHEATPRDMNRAVCINPGAQVSIVDALKALFHSSTEIERQYEQGTMGLAAGFKWSMDQNIVTHTVGPLGGTPLVNGASQTGSSLVTDGWTAAAAARLNRGDVFTIASVNAVNPQHRQSTGQLRQFVVTANVSSDGSGNATIPIYPAITTSGAFQTVTASPADNAAITVLGAAATLSPQNLAFHKEAFVLGCADLVMPGGVDMASRVSSKTLGMSIRMVRAYDINTDAFPCRLDVLYGWKAVYPELACRIAG